MMPELAATLGGLKAVRAAADVYGRYTGGPEW